MRDALGDVQSVLVLGGGSDIGAATVIELAKRRCRTAILAGRDPARLSLLPAKGDSMLPLIHDGDMMLVDESDRRPGARGGVYVIRLDDALIVKRVNIKAGQVTVTSDNPDYPPIAPRAADEVEVVGRVVWLSRSL